MDLWCERIFLYSDLFNMGKNNNIGEVENQQFVIIPLSSEPTFTQHYSLNVRQEFEYKNQQNVSFWFTTTNGRILEFTSPAYIILDFLEGVHQQ